MAKKDVTSASERTGKDKIKKVKPINKDIVAVGGGSFVGKPNPVGDGPHINLPPGVRDPLGPRMKEEIINAVQIRTEVIAGKRKAEATKSRKKK